MLSTTSPLESPHQQTGNTSQAKRETAIQQLTKPGGPIHVRLMRLGKVLLESIQPSQQTSGSIPFDASCSPSLILHFHTTETGEIRGELGPCPPLSMKSSSNVNQHGSEDEGHFVTVPMRHDPDPIFHPSRSTFMYQTPVHVLSELTPSEQDQLRGLLEKVRKRQGRVGPLPSRVILRQKRLVSRRGGCQLQ